ncbi:helix-turn-helix domain-containing protein [Streptantibioticus silvisoli]|uniref:Helix-turn-helix transcriptional regulator n=1 Tax=Streptantibioticus silvisoli TaxID=2705255 RepID=A0ABT6W4F1_9ACTN|nr:helix-turn-helix transcriptional regulator [Streptantibioticus silvisoli]MDI5965624.1 helix-turn-helix transcriptional regulator [Streptantibioticus silvisoli]
MPARARVLRPERSARDLFGAEMRRCREQEGMSLERLGGIVGFSKSVLSRVETADAMMAPDLPARLDATFHTGGLFQKLYALARKEVHPDQFRRRMELEARARTIHEYAGQLVPGIVQTEEYARAQFKSGNPRATRDEIGELLLARMLRQGAVREADPAPDVALILDEAVLRRSYGGPKVMRGQLERLADMAFTPTSTVQILPFTHGEHALAGGTLALWTMDDGTQVAYEESITTGTLIEDADVVKAHRRAYDLLRACALSPRDSAAFIRSVMEDLPA